MLDDELRLFEKDGVGAVLAFPLVDHVFAKEVGGLKEDVVHGGLPLDELQVADDNVREGRNVFFVIVHGKSKWIHRLRRRLHRFLLLLQEGGHQGCCCG